MKILFFYFIFVVLVFFSWFFIAIFITLINELLGVSYSSGHGGILSGVLAIIFAKWAWGFSQKLTSKKQKGD